MMAIMRKLLWTNRIWPNKLLLYSSPHNLLAAIFQCHQVQSSSFVPSSSSLSFLILTSSLILLFLPLSSAQKLLENLSCDFNDDTICEWTSNVPIIDDDDRRVYDAGQVRLRFDANFNRTNDYEAEFVDRILLIRPPKTTPSDGRLAPLPDDRQAGMFTLRSPSFTSSGDYDLQFNVNKNFAGFIYVVVIDESTESQILKISSGRDKRWGTYSIKLPKYIQMNVILEVKFESNQEYDYVALDNLKITDQRAINDQCDYRCKPSPLPITNENNEPQCLPANAICDTIRDCAHGDDEELNCDKLPVGSYCSFQENFCHWFNFDNGNSTGQWIHAHNNNHHSVQNVNNGYLGVTFKGAHRFGAISYLKSPIFSPIPFYHSFETSKYYKSCKARFSFSFASSSADLALELEPIPIAAKGSENFGRSKEPLIQVWRHFNRRKSNANQWQNVSTILPINFHGQYRLKFGAALGLKSFSTFSFSKISVAIDNFSLAKECFGIDVPENEPRQPPFIPALLKGIPFSLPTKLNQSIKSFTFTTCGASGRLGPSYSQCEGFYLNSTTRAAVFENENLKLNGSQMWTVPKSAYYTIFARGADGGSGLHQHAGGRGALVRAVFFLQEGDTIFIAVGQSGTNACPPTPVSSSQAGYGAKEAFTICAHLNSTESSSAALSATEVAHNRETIDTRAINKIEVGGGGGGATYVFKFKPHRPEKWYPLLIAAGGGGGSGKSNPDLKYSKNQHGQGFDFYNIGSSGSGAGSGGGWNASAGLRSAGIYANYKTNPNGSQSVSGESLLFGGAGGVPCRRISKQAWSTNGGFGGGGGGCQFGGGGGGFHGGNAATATSEAGEGGTSYVDFGHSYLALFNDDGDEDIHAPDISMDSGKQKSGKRDGLVMIIPQIDACCNEGRYPCVIIGESSNRSEPQQHPQQNPLLQRQCICGHDKFMQDICLYERPFYLTLLWIALCLLFILFLLFFVPFLLIQKRSAASKIQRTDSNDLHLLSASSSTDVQLSRLRNQQHILTEYNPNYEFGGSTCTLRDLQEIPREHLTLVNALGQGAFGEVYQGFLHNQPGEIAELPVAVKTLPEYSANKQAEMDFVMEAMIMSKFNNKNIVRFIGVCFEKMPRFIVLELLPGGDLKTFLRENRSTIDAPSPLVMGDLLVMALDVAAGCRYLEEHHFIHRDIAARNCLLTRKVKIPSSLSSGCGNRTREGSYASSFGDMKDYSNGFNNSGIVVKIADFGMARDIYRADYYRKGGKAMLPVKWMPPEAFLDGVFTSKTDAWSFGVLLWEVMSMGYMPYPGRGNQEVMSLVTSGGRLEPPNSSTPGKVYQLMMQCWNVTPELRPNFASIMDRILNTCLNNLDVLAMPLPVFHRSASVEKDVCINQNMK